MTIKKAGVLLVVILALALAGCGGGSDSQSTAADQNVRCLGVEEVREAINKIVFAPNQESEPEDEQREKVEAVEEQGCQAQK